MDVEPERKKSWVILILYGEKYRRIYRMLRGTGRSSCFSGWWVFQQPLPACVKAEERQKMGQTRGGHWQWAGWVRSGREGSQSRADARGRGSRRTSVSSTAEQW